MMFYLSIDGSNKGPLDLKTIERDYRAGRLAGSTPCWTDSWPAWRPIAEAFPEWGANRLKAAKPVVERVRQSPGSLDRLFKTIMVLLAGLVSSCALGAVMALGQKLTGYTVYGWMILGVVPIGAFFAGIGGTIGSFFAARWLHYYPRLFFGFATTVIGLLTLVITQYCINSNFGLDAALRWDLAGFQKHLIWISHHVTLSLISRTPLSVTDIQLGEASIWYYVLQVGGFSAGGLGTLAAVRERPFCRDCQSFFALHQIAEFHEKNSDVFSRKFDTAQRILENGYYADAQRHHPIKSSLKDRGFEEGFRSSLTTFRCPVCRNNWYRHKAYAYKRKGGWSEISSLTKNYPPTGESPS